MKLFVRDQILFVVLFLLQLGSLLLIFQLDGYSSQSIVMYAIFLSIFFLGVYLIIRYLANRKVYQALGHSIQSLDELNQSLGETPLAEALADTFQQQYRLYMEQLHLHESKQREYNTFIQQWVHQMKTPSRLFTCCCRRRKALARRASGKRWIACSAAWRRSSISPDWTGSSRIF